MSLFLTADGVAETGLLDTVKSFFANFALENLLSAIVVTVLCLIVVKILMKIVDRVLRKAQHIDGTIKSLIRVMIKILLLFVAIIIVLTCLGIPVTSLIAVLSVCGLAISLAVQNFLSNVAGGLQLATSKPFKEGDFVEANGCSGFVREVGLFYTKLNSLDNKLIQIPNSAIVASNIINYSSEERRHVEIKVSASYDMPCEKVKATLARVVGEHPLTLNTPEPLIHVFEYQESTIQYIVRAWCATEDYWTVYFDLLDAIKPAFEADGVKMSYPHVNVHMAEK